MSDPEILATQQNDASFEDVWDELVWRGLVQVSTDPAALKELLAGEPITFYCGFDPTAPSLHLGNLVQLLTMRRLQLAGHKPLGLVGGSTGLIGDPRPTAERTLNTKETVAEWVGYLKAQVSRFLSAEGSNAVRLVNNLDWTEGLSAIDFLRDIGKHYRVGTMLKKDAVASRLNSEAGISYTEFSYQILQGFDYLELHRQSMAVPTRLARDLEPAHRIVAGEDVLEGAGQHVVRAGRAVGRRRTLVEHVQGRALAAAQRFVEHVVLAPARQDLFLQRGEALIGVHGAVARHER